MQYTFIRAIIRNTGMSLNNAFLQQGGFSKKSRLMKEKGYI